MLLVDMLCLTHENPDRLARNLVQPVLGDHRATSALDVQARDCTEELLCQGQAGFEQCRAWQELGQMRDARDEGIRP